MTAPLFPIIEVRKGQSSHQEAMGTKAKFWVELGGDVRHLFKTPRPGTGEHWAEKVVAEIGHVLGIPVAEVELARCEGVLGSLSRSFLGKAQELEHGNQVLQHFDESYDPDQKRRATGHTVEAIFSALEEVDPPAELGAQLDARETFVGYLMLDALVLNCDRHHENWGVRSSGAGRRQLTPSYDHASSLGRELTDERREARLRTNDPRQNPAYYASKARSALYAAEGATAPFSPIDAFARSALLCPTGAQFWVARVAERTQADWQALLERVPAEIISAPAREFALVLLASTHQALLTRFAP